MTNSQINKKMENQPELLDIDEIISNSTSFKNIMADRIVTDKEMQEQSDRVVSLLNEAETRFKGDDLAFIKRLFAEANVLSAIYHYYELQNLSNNVNL